MTKPQATAHFKLNTAPSFTLGTAIVRPFSGANITVAHVEFPVGTEVAVHSHPHEQLSIIETGILRFTVGDDAPFDAGPGDLVYVPGDVPHSVEVIEDAVYIDMFSPVRQEFMDKLTDAPQ